MKTVTLIKNYNLNGNIKKAGTELTCTTAKINELAAGEYIKTDKRFKKQKPLESAIKIETAESPVEPEKTTVKPKK